MARINVQSPNIRYSDGAIEADYEYENVKCVHDTKSNTIKVSRQKYSLSIVCLFLPIFSLCACACVQAYPMKTVMTFRTNSKVPRVGVMLVGWGGNNGATVTAAILANRHSMSFRTKDGEVKANYFGSITQSSTVFLGNDTQGKDVYVPMKDMVPMVNPNDLFVDGWDISAMNLADAMQRSKVLDISLQDKLRPYMESLKPRKAIYDPEFIAANQSERADNVIQTNNKWMQVEQIRADIRDFKQKNSLDTVIVLWTANTERFSEVIEGVHDTAENLIAAIKRNEPELAPSALYAVASILEKVRLSQSHIDCLDSDC